MMNRFSEYICLLAFSVLIPLQLNGQGQPEAEPLFIIAARYHRSLIIQHTQKLKDEVTQSNPWCIEADLNWHLRKRGTWVFCYCYPRTGISLRYTNFDLPEVLGSAISVYPFIEPYVRAEKPLNFAIRFGIGPAFMTRVYDAKTNPDNLFFSSHVSFIALLGFSCNYRIDERMSFRLSASYNHISNAGYSEPNLGINFPGINAGLDYSFQRTGFPSWDRDPGLMLVEKKNRYDFSLAMSAKPITEGKHEKRYPVYGLTVNYSRALGRVFALAGGIEWVNDRSLKEKFEKENRTGTGGGILDHNRAGMLAGIEWLFGRFVFYQQFGCYLYAPYREKGYLYQRYGLNFTIHNHIFAGLNIKAHGQDADYMDLRIGVCL